MSIVMVGEPVRSLSRPGLRDRARPFVAVAAMAFGAAALPSQNTDDAALVIASLSTLLIIAVAAFVPWHRLPSWAETVPPLSFLVVVLLLCAACGGAASGYAPMAGIPVIWFALYGRRGETVMAAAGCAGAFLIPQALGGTATEWRPAIMGAVVIPLVGVAIQRAVDAQRDARDELKDALAQLAHEQRRLRDERDFTDTVLETAEALVVVLDRAGGIVRFNRASEHASGRHEHEVLGRRY